MWCHIDITLPNSGYDSIMCVYQTEAHAMNMRKALMEAAGFTSEDPYEELLERRRLVAKVASLPIKTVVSCEVDALLSVDDYMKTWIDKVLEARNEQN